MEGKFEPKYISVYGTLRSGFGNNRLMQGSTLIGEALTVEEHGLYASGIPYVSENGGQWGGPKTRVKVEVYQVNSQSDMDSIDSLEGYDASTGTGWYLRRPCQVQLEDGTILDTEIYFMEVSEEQSKRLTYIESGDYADYRATFRY